LGVFAKVEQAPYDPILSAEAQKGFVRRLPRGEADYVDACRAYADVLYGRILEGSKSSRFLDKTPAYALIGPFLTQVFPDASFIVLTRHPAAIFSSFANSFFVGDYREAHAHNPILTRYVPALAELLRSPQAATFHLRYEDLVREPERWLRQVCDFVGVDFEAGTIAYGGGSGGEGLGDPTGVAQHAQPSTQSLDKWARELAVDAGKREFMGRLIAELNPDDLRTLGYPPDTLYEPLERIGGTRPAPRRLQLSRYRLQRWLIVRLRRLVRRRGLFRRLLERLRLACDVLLRPQV
jgi:hypothetical protein